jgi:hypothetical protein
VGKVADTDSGNTKLYAVDRRYFVNSTAATGDTQDAENCIGSTAGNTQSAGVPNTYRSSDLYPLNSF